MKQRRGKQKLFNTCVLGYFLICHLIESSQLSKEISEAVPISQML